MRVDRFLFQFFFGNGYICSLYRSIVYIRKFRVVKAFSLKQHTPREKPHYTTAAHENGSDERSRAAHSHVISTLKLACLGT